MSTAQLSTIFVVLLTDILLHGDWVHEGTVLEVDRALRNDWKGSGMCRDATEEEIAEARAEQGAAELIGDDLQDLARQKGDLEDEVAALQDRKTELAGDLKALESDLEEFGKRRDTLQGEVEDLAGKQKALAAEVAALEKAKQKAGAK
ncbi:hypothetical protein [Pseudomonas aeruginosa]|uniref:hypothetical protein n=1 Tax=Pseudomonas aeruginosa TaxID=287 RepID=UPI00053D47C3|nr:hypothetical protein [Pseudomonas aeruginosa]